jgi:hypothetical protein
MTYVNNLIFTFNSINLPNIGSEFAGGYFAGIINYPDKNNYAIIVSSKKYGEKKLQWRIDKKSSYYDGYFNCEDSELISAFKFCRCLLINNYNDWYLPSRNELEICYRNLKPTNHLNRIDCGINIHSIDKDKYSAKYPKQTNIIIFQENNQEYFNCDWYWSSTSFDLEHSWAQHFMNGSQDNNCFIYHYYFVRAIRKVLLI